eukprot:CAMPEP_0119511256 /NCGR_PEP_ID=MMETSP1344-20130328/29963_1 /TAXON_ID=236787 /ORGANISM="Florenciella parvula, Strain CCMP2471" /LENGTH=117 /DNA_ID=CAMNT_0007548243 /DNA_START=12 /DNA_END=361 /DNA_ORIENTATION=+
MEDPAYQQPPHVHITRTGSMDYFPGGGAGGGGAVRITTGGEGGATAALPPPPPPSGSRGMGSGGPALSTSSLANELQEIKDAMRKLEMQSGASTPQLAGSLEMPNGMAGIGGGSSGG